MLFCDKRYDAPNIARPREDAIKQNKIKQNKKKFRRTSLKRWSLGIYTRNHWQCFIQLC